MLTLRSVKKAGLVLTFYEFFAGGGMARAGLGGGWRCLAANEIDPHKVETYRRNWGDDAMIPGDVRDLAMAGLPGQPDLVWASFPCQDLSLAGSGAGLKGERSGTFWPFWQHVTDLVAAGRAPGAIILENVCGLLTANGGADMAAIIDAMARAGYRAGALIIDAALFVPQSRKRLFIIALSAGRALPAGLTSPGPDARWCSPALVRAHDRLNAAGRARWVWWSLPAPPPRQITLDDILEPDGGAARWHGAAETRQLIAMMSDRNREKLRAAMADGSRLTGTLYKRTRRDPSGSKIQRAEVRFDGMAGCLRTPAGGSSRQTVLIVEGHRLRSRLLSAREAAALMGLGDDYRLPARYNAAYHLLGDGVVVPVVRYLARHILEPALNLEPTPILEPALNLEPSLANRQNAPTIAA